MIDFLKKTLSRHRANELFKSAFGFNDGSGDVEVNFELARKALAAGADPDVTLGAGKGTALYEVFGSNANRVGPGEEIRFIADLIDAGANPFHRSESEPSTLSRLLQDQGKRPPKTRDANLLNTLNPFTVTSEDHVFASSPDGWAKSPILRACKRADGEALAIMMRSPFAPAEAFRMFPSSREDAQHDPNQDPFEDSKPDLKSARPPVDWNLAMLAAYCNMPTKGLQAIQDAFEAHVLPASPQLGANHLWTRLDSRGRNALMLSHGAAHPVGWLLEQPALGMSEHLEVRSTQGKTALWMFAECGRKESCLKIISAGAETDIVNNEGENLIDVLENPDRNRKTRSMDLLLHLSGVNKASSDGEVAEMLRSVGSSRAATAAIDGVMALGERSDSGAAKAPRP